MTKVKTSVTIDQTKLDEVRRLTGAKTTSAAIDKALSELIAIERIRADVAAYRRQPPTDAEIALAGGQTDWTDLADDTDWEKLYEASE